jgi:hypothetical protein
MAVPTLFNELIGAWQGTNRLWLDPEEPARESESSALITLAAQGQFATIQYTWADGGRPQDGLIVLGRETQGDLLKAAWIDSWHMGDKLMVSEGLVEPDGSIWVMGTYAVPSEPDWGWRISIDSIAKDTFRMTMHNISPDGADMLAVEALYARKP